jgi:aminoglycoside 2''-phosphotransferase
MGEVELYKNIIERCFPQLPIYSIESILEGWDNFVLEVNREYIFRFPKRAAVVPQLEKEIRLLPELSRTISVPVPLFEFVWHEKGESPDLFVGYRKLDGVPFQKEFVTSPQMTHLAQQLARFLNELHFFPVQQAIRLAIPNASPKQWRQKYINLYGQVQLRVYPMLTDGERARTALLWEDFLKNEANFRFQPVLLHGDLSGEHILCDVEKAMLTGIIDWGDACIGDPAMDCTWLLNYGNTFTEKVLGSYKGMIDGTFLQRATFYSRISPFFEILFGLDTDDQLHIKQGMEYLRLELPEWSDVQY